LIEGLRALSPNGLRIVGVGGSQMRAAGLQSLYSLDDTSVMGLREVVPRLRRIVTRVYQAVNFAVRLKPDIVVVIDSPDFTHNVAKRIRRRMPDLKIVDYVAPQVWASRPKRAAKMAKFFDHVLCLLPFEVQFFAQAGLPATFVGHPVIERAPAPGTGAAFRAKYGIDAAEKVLVLLPGSRVSEVRFLWPVFQAAVDRAEAAAGRLRVVIPTVPTVAARVRARVAEWGREVIVVEGPEDKFGAFDAADVALAASGTVTTELALAATPMVVGYRVGRLTATIARRFIKVPFITLVNLILKREAIPELVQEECTAENLSGELIKLLMNPAARVSQVTASAEAVKAIGLGDEKPSVRAARAVLKLLDEPRKKPAPKGAA
jgi:lipid-A-disaccharide synthase